MANRNRLKPKSENQAEAIRLIAENVITFAHGPAGCGKTLLAVGLGIEHLLEDKVKKIVITRPIVESGGSIGFIPGPQPLDAKVLTPNGWVTMGELSVGDEAISRDGTPTKVMGVFPKGKKDVFRVTTTDGRVTECCLDHLWYTHTTEEIRGVSHGNVRSTKDILATIRNKDGGVNHFLPFSEPAQLNSKQPSLQSPYALGVLLGSGLSPAYRSSGLIDSLNQYIRLFEITRNNKKHELATTVAKNVFKSPTNLCAAVSCGQSNVALAPAAMVSCGGGSNTSSAQAATVFSSDAFIPKAYKYSNVADRTELLKGLMDIGGNVKRGVAHFSTASQQLSLDVIELVRSLGGSVDQKKITGIFYEFAIRLPGNINPFCFSKKAKRVTAKRSRIGIEKIEKIGKKQVQCIRVDNPEHLYITDDYIVTHNTAEEKLHPYLLPILDSLEMFIPVSQYVSLKSNGKIEIVPLGFMRGRSFHNCFIVADECQNASYDQLKMLLTRIGSNSKMVLTGDVKQSDLPRHQQGGFMRFISALEGIEGIGMAELTNVDIVRHPIIGKILDRLEYLDEENEHKK